MKKRIGKILVYSAVVAAAVTLGACSSNNDNNVAATPGVPTFVVKDTSGAVVAGATVYAIPTADVAQIGTQPITLDGATGNYTAASKNVDEPLEDLINGNYTPSSGGVSTYKSGVTDADGKVVLTGLPTGSSDAFFIYVKPADADAGHLPGGSLCRTAVSGASVASSVTSVKISTRPTGSATYVGSSICLVCHSSYATETKTLHKLGIMVPKSPSNMQDVSKFQGSTDDENFYAGLNRFEGAGTSLYYYGFDSVKNTFKVLTSAPTGTVYFRLDLSKSGSAFRVTFNNIITPADPMTGTTFDVALTYGGGLHKQRYLTKIDNSVYVLPIQFNPQGSDSSPDKGGRTQFLEYNTVSGGWWLASSATFTTPSVSKKYKAFDIFCAGCHFTGYSVEENIDETWSASAVADANGEIHPVTGAKMEMNIGCEVCHGPGSDHMQAGGDGKFIVSPSNLTPERETMICGACHTRGESLGTAGTHGPVEALLDTDLKQIMPGTSRAEFLANNTSRNDAKSTDGLWSDGKHSSKHHQQYTDYIQTKKYRNGTSIKTCANCHDVHAPGTDKHQLSGTSDNTLCTSCHTTTEVVAHMKDKAGFNMGTGAKCTGCHATKTAKSGSGTPTPTMTGASGAKYYQGDISSHRLDVPLKTSATPSTGPMPVPYTSGCGYCHSNSGL